MQTGNIGVKTENIFPVIKKFLYSDQEIFLREIISNAVDATQKLKALAASGEFKGELGDLTIKVEVDKKKKTLTVRDRGIGMNAEEVDKARRSSSPSSRHKARPRRPTSSDILAWASTPPSWSLRRCH